MAYWTCTSGKLIYYSCPTSPTQRPQSRNLAISFFRFSYSENWFDCTAFDIIPFWSLNFEYLHEVWIRGITTNELISPFWFWVFGWQPLEEVQSCQYYVTGWYISKKVIISKKEISFSRQKSRLFGHPEFRGTYLYKREDFHSINYSY